MLIVFTQLGDQRFHVWIRSSRCLHDAISNAFERPFVAEREGFPATVEPKNFNRLFSFGLWNPFRIEARG